MRHPGFLLAALTSAAAIAACGAPPAVEPPRPEATAPIALPSSVPSSVPTAMPSGVPSAGPAAGAVVMGNNTPIKPSALLADVQKLGIDTTKPFASMSMPQKKQLMKLFKKALGYDSCNGCHVPDQFDKPTRNKEITRKMWDNFLVPLRDDHGGALFCDSCHNGKAKSLDRTAMDGLMRIMETDYQGKLTRADKQPHDCSTCHGKGKEPEPHIIEKLWGIAAK